MVATNDDILNKLNEILIELKEHNPKTIAERDMLNFKAIQEQKALLKNKA